MCSNYESIGDTKALEDWFSSKRLPLALDKKSIRPTDLAFIFGINKQPHMLSWGIPMIWQDGKKTQPIINARAETITQKHIFRPILNHRCLIPATTWFEWRKVGDKKLKYRIKLQDEPLFTFAGLVSDNHFIIITCESAPSLSHIHSRMPVILSPEVQSKWLDKQIPFEALAKHLVPYFNNSFKYYEERPAQFELFT